MSATPRKGEMSPVVELEGLLARLENRLHRASEAYIESIRPPEPPSEDQKGFFFGNFRRTPKASTTPTTTPDASSPAHHRDEAHQLKQKQSASAGIEEPAAVLASQKARNSKQSARFIDIPEIESLVEDLRRIAEIVVIGENYVTSQERKVQKELEQSRQKWNKDRDMLNDSSELDEASEAVEQSPDYADVFDLFFERNTLATLVELLTGRGFDTPEVNEVVAKAEAYAKAHSGENGTTTPRSNKQRRPPVFEKSLLLPPLAVATQAVQSISILVQNVSRAQSLYIIFSNDHINDMIGLELDLYEQAERARRMEAGESVGTVFSSPELAELTTHFVTCLKSLALRMNVETLQFFLQYPDNEPFVKKEGASNGSQLIEGYDPSSLRVSFPLYDRALDFCAAHQDSFVRVTAMNVCLNTIRLATVSPNPPPPLKEGGEDLEEMEGAFGSAVKPSSANARSTSTPQAALHDAQALPFRERLAIAQHTCTPSRVERLIAPIFSKLSERWTSLDESIREMDACEIAAATESSNAGGSRSEKVAKVKEKVKREKMVNTFRDRAADLQDELLLLEDVFKVGLTVLNEQMIEMMMATFVYPLLLQPLILFSQRYTATVADQSLSVRPSPSTLNHPFGAPYTDDYSWARSQLVQVTGPAKTALFTMAAAFQYLTNPPLLRLMFTALLHPISPDSTTVPTVRSSLQVASVDVYGRGTIRVDAQFEGEIVPDSRVSYPFGTNEINRRTSSSEIRASDEREGGGEEACVFVLAPALAEVLEFRGQDFGLIARTRPNSYRRALVQCLEMETTEFSQVRALAVCCVDAAMSRLDPKLATDLLYGVNLKTFSDDIPIDERNLDSTYAYEEHDRGLGGGVQMESRHTIATRRGVVGSNLIGQVTTPLVSAVLISDRGRNKEWDLSFDGLAAHSLLLAGKGNAGGLLAAAKALEMRRNQAAQFLARLPELLHTPMGGGPASYFLVGVPHVNVADYDQQMYGAVMNVIVNGVSAGEKDAPTEKFLQLQKTSTDESPEGYSMEISCTGGFDEMTNRIVRSFMADVNAAETKRSLSRDFMEMRQSVVAFFQADAFLSLLKESSATGGAAFRNVDVAGVALSKNGTFVQTMDYKLSKMVFAPVSRQLADLLVSATGSVSAGDEGSVASGTRMKLAGYPAIPCVCEAPASLSHLFVNKGSGIVAQGVTWQSLYLVFRDRWMIFAQPIPGGASSEGRVIGACLLERTFVDKDAAPVDNGSPARRLLFAYSSFDADPPPLFLFDELPEEDRALLGRVRSKVSLLDVWCENEKTTEYAYQIASSQIFAAKAKRGRRIQAYLSPQQS